MPQKIILNNLHKYAESYCKDIMEIDFETLSKGACFHFALCHAAMNAIGMRPWWQSALHTTAIWDGRAESLQLKILLPNAIAFCQVNDIFERMLHYTAYHQSRLKGNARISDLLIYSFFHKEGFFDIIDRDGKTQTFKSREIVGDEFTFQQISDLLDEKFIHNSVCVLIYNDHAISIRFEGSNWYLYDPNYDHTQIESMEKSFNDKKMFIEEIIKIIGNSFVIFVANFQPSEPFLLKRFNEIMKSKYFSRSPYTLAMLATYCPESLNTIFEKALLNESDAKDLAMNMIFSYKERGTVFHYIVGKSPLFDKSLPMFLPNLLKIVEYAPVFLLVALNSKDKEGYTLFQFVAKYAPKYLLSILRLVQASPDGDKYILMALVAQTSICENTGFNYLIFSGEQLSDILEFISAIPEGTMTIAKAICLKNKEGETGLRYFSRYAPQYLFKLMEVILNIPNGFSFIKEASTNLTPLIGILMALHIPNSIPILCHLLFKKYSSTDQIKDISSFIYKLLFTPINLGTSVLHTLAESAPHVFEWMISQYSSGVGYIKILQIHMENKDRDNKTPLDYIALLPQEQKLKLMLRLEKHGIVQPDSNPMSLEERATTPFWRQDTLDNGKRSLEPYIDSSNTENPINKAPKI